MSNISSTTMPFTSKFIEKTVKLDFYQKWKAEKPQFFESTPLFLCSFPRSGNGWVRLVLAAILLQSKGVDLDTVQLDKKTTDKGVKYVCFRSGDTEYDIEDIFPDIYLIDQQKPMSNSVEAVKSLQLPIQMIKTHHIVDCQSSKVIFLFREPLSCLTSAALLLNSDEIEKNPQAINQTMIYLAKHYNQMLQFYWKQKKEYPDQCFLLSHAKASEKDTALEFEKVIEFMGISTQDNVVQKGINKFPFKSGYKKEYIDSIQDATREYIQTHVEPNYQKVLNLSN
ncbi:MAG: sulfotransferase domain-containing protein [Microcoleaceae cyanobacterium]